MREDFANTSIPLFNKSMHFNHPQEMSEPEKFRIGRAFYRFEMMRELFCFIHEPWFIGENDMLSLDFALFDMYSPWVNEQLSCVYAYLRKRSTKVSVPRKLQRNVILDLACL